MNKIPLPKEDTAKIPFLRYVQKNAMHKTLHRIFVSNLFYFNPEQDALIARCHESCCACPPYLNRSKGGIPPQNN